MNLRRIPVMVTIVAILVISSVLAIFLVSEFNYKNSSSGIVLPSENAQTDNPSGVSSVEVPNYNDVPLEVTTQNIKSLIESLDRPENYIMHVDNIYYYGDVFSVIYSNVYRYHGFTRIERYNENSQNEILIIGNSKVYSWVASETEYFTTNQGDFTTDEMIYIRSFEDISHVPDENITQANVEYITGKPYVIVIADYEGYSEKYVVSLEYGLLVEYEKYTADTLLLKIQVSDIGIDIVDETYFVLPDNSNPLS